VESVFSLLANQSKIPRLNKLMIAPFQLQRSLIEKVEKTASAAAQGVAIPFVRDGNHACALTGGDFARTVGATVVSDHDLAGDSSRLDAQKGLANAGGEGFCLIEARHDDRKVHE
jgi:hypothetical protein